MAIKNATKKVVPCLNLVHCVNNNSDFYWMIYSTGTQNHVNIATMS